MDNVAHTLAGVLVGRSFDRREGAGAAVSVWTAIVASNLPDAETLLPPVVNGGKVQFLLHHRGWTHTLIASPVLAVLAVVIVVVVRASYDRTPGTTLMERIVSYDFRRLSVIALAAVGLHLCFDFLSNYGIHPFPPVSRVWIYGDSVFTLEPLLWWSILPFALRNAATRRRRRAWAAVGFLPLVVLLAVGPFSAALVCALLAAGMFAVQAKLPGTLSAWVTAAAVLCVFWGGGVLARSKVSSAVQSGAPDERVLDLVTTPAPGNPLCWRAQTVGLTADDYVAREAWVSLLPGLYDASSCYPLHGMSQTARLAATAVPGDRHIAWRGEFRASRTALREQLEDCRILGVMSFVRIPFWLQDGHRWVFGDLRFDVSEGHSFAEIRMSNTLGKCRKGPWLPPRHDLLDAIR